MRLLYLHPVPVPSISANAVQVAKMCDAFSGAGVDTVLVTPAQENVDDSYEGIARVYKLKHKFAVEHAFLSRVRGNNLIFALHAILKLWGRDPFIIYTRAIPICFLAYLLRIPFVIERHVPVALSRRLVVACFRTMCRSPLCLQMVVITEKLRDYYETTFPMLKGRVCVAHDGADVFDPREALPPADLPAGFNVGYVGHLYPGKGMEIVLPLARACPWATFHIVGGRPEDIALWKGKAEQLTNIIFHGHVTHAMAGAYIAAMDVVLAPYLRQVSGSAGSDNLAEWMSPLKMFEYMAQAKAMLASDLPVLREVLRDGENAMLCDPDQIESWVAALDKLYKNEDLRRKLGATGQADFLAHYTWGQRAARILATIQNI